MARESKRRRSGDAGDDDDRPMTESQWEAFMKEADLRAARFGELLETLHEDPDHEAKIRHEMGWDRPRPRTEADDEMDAFRNEVFEAANRELTGEEREELDREMAEEDAALEALPAYRKAMALAERVGRVVRPLFHKHADDEDVAEAYANAIIPAAKIAGGHGMGYEDDVLGGNIVNCKRALEATVKCHEAWERVRQRKLVNARTGAAIAAQLADTRAEIERHIADLRSRVWW